MFAYYYIFIVTEIIQNFWKCLNKRMIFFNGYKKKAISQIFISIELQIQMTCVFGQMFNEKS